MMNRIGLGMIALIALAPWLAGPFILHLAILTCLNILVVNGLAIIERSGQLSVVHAACMCPLTPATE